MRRRKSHPRKGAYSLEHCLHQSARALHPVQRLAWLMVLVESYADRAIEPLLKSLGVALNRPSPFVELGEALSWALGQLGREILIPIGDRFKDAPFLVREHYCQALWYLGPQARGSQAWLKNQHTEWAEAVLYRLEGLGSQALIERRRVPIWLDQQSLSQLAELAFSQEPGDRHYALRALDSWGPQRAQAIRLVRATLADPDDEVKLQAWRTLLSMGERPGAAEVYLALSSQHRQLVQLAGDHCDLLLGRQPPLEALETSLDMADEARAGLALARMLARPFPAQRLRRFLGLMHRLNSAQQSAAAGWMVAADWWAEDWARMVELEPPCPPLLDTLAERAAATLQLYLQPALRQRLLSRLQDLKAGAKLLEQLQGACLTWDRLFSLSSERLKGALEAIVRTGEMPEQLLETLYAGEWIQSESLELMARLTPPQQLPERLDAIFEVAMPEQRGCFDEVLERLPDQGWALLASWLERPALSEAAMDMLDRKLKRQPESWSKIWELAAAASTRGRRDWVVAQAVCKLHHPEHFEMAAQLAEKGDFRSAMHALEFLHEHYSIRERPLVLEITLNCLKHTAQAVRLDALRHLRLSAPLPEAIIDELLSADPDPEPTVETARLNLIRELTHLTPDQQLKATRLTRLD